MRIFDVPLEELRRRRSIKWSRFEPDVLPMFVAEMDVHLLPAVQERLNQMLADGDTGYPEQPEYQEAYADFAAETWGLRLDPGSFRVGCDTMAPIRELTAALTEPGDGVAFNPPIYPPFRWVVRAAGCRPVEVPLKDGRLDLEALEQAFATEQVKVYLLCSPHNPNGTLHTQQELTRVMELANRHGVAVISDEIHAPLSGGRHTPILMVPGGERAFMVVSSSKAFNLAALKAGLIVPGAAVVEVVAGLGPQVHEAASYFGVTANATALRHGRDWLAQLREEIEENKAHFVAELAARLPQLTWTPSEGTYLAWLDCTPLGLEHPGQHFHEQARVRFNFGQDFDPRATQHVRVNLATSKELISEAVRRMADSI
ncbi:aminotransferase class I/II-fold pyridoxal phosphate-dependent enzyme [Arachnia propionica]|uniref:cysteine-S-conjugate beta-lyase n=1 Tax=Arachnia propionica TaxID=1750 RepID=A0A3P1T512_9ACTN|nr:aminotransferase class I/II-fold pyridoxal phosphate-dependent enzyme [Arachnia propionica]RRD04561.1 aminotransferase class I/II-fold pyridoxal phosphate-dependent enzyme [Arachnia propionica]